MGEAFGMNKTIESALLLVGAAACFYGAHQLRWGDNFDGLGFLLVGVFAWRAVG